MVRPTLGTDLAGADRDRLLTATEAADRLRITVQTIYNWASTRRYGEIGVKIGRKRMFAESWVERLAAGDLVLEIGGANK